MKATDQQKRDTARLIIEAARHGRRVPEDMAIALAKMVLEIPTATASGPHATGRIVLVAPGTALGETDDATRFFVTPTKWSREYPDAYKFPSEGAAARVRASLTTQGKIKAGVEVVSDYGLETEVRS